MDPLPRKSSKKKVKFHGIKDSFEERILPPCPQQEVKIPAATIICFLRRISSISTSFPVEDLTKSKEIACRRKSIGGFRVSKTKKLRFSSFEVDPRWDLKKAAAVDFFFFRF